MLTISRFVLSDHKYIFYITQCGPLCVELPTNLSFLPLHLCFFRWTGSRPQANLCHVVVVNTWLWREKCKIRNYKKRKDYRKILSCAIIQGDNPVRQTVSQEYNPTLFFSPNHLTNCILYMKVFVDSYCPFGLFLKMKLSKQGVGGV